MNMPMAVRSSLPLVLAAVLLSGCGLAETGVSAAAGAKAEADAAQQAKQVEDKVKAQLEDAQRVEAEQRKAIDKAADQ